jgi:hypothetical protein
MRSTAPVVVYGAHQQYQSATQLHPIQALNKTKWCLPYQVVYKTIQGYCCHLLHAVLAKEAASLMVNVRILIGICKKILNN